MKNSEPTLNPHVSLSGPVVPPPEPLPEVTASRSRSSLRKRRSTIQHFMKKLHVHRGGSELDGSEQSGSKLNRSRGDKINRKESRFAEWRKKNFGGGRRHSEQVRRTSSHGNNESPKSHHENFRKSASIDNVQLVDPNSVKT